MTVERPRALDAAPSKSDDSKVLDVISNQVLQSLGRPDHLRGVNVRQLWDQHYRVNVYVSRDPGVVTVAHSYFVLADAEGRIIVSDPVISRTYEPVAAQQVRPTIEG